MITSNDLSTLTGATVYGSNGEKIGRAGQTYVDYHSGEPEWVTVNTGLFGTHESFVPLRHAEMTGDGLTVPYTKDHIKDAPNVDPENGHLDESEEQRLFDHYDVGTGGTVGDRRQEASASDGDTVGRDTSGPVTDDAMTRSEEQLRVDRKSVV